MYEARKNKEKVSRRIDGDRARVGVKTHFLLKNILNSKNHNFCDLKITQLQKPFNIIDDELSMINEVKTWDLNDLKNLHRMTYLLEEAQERKWTTLEDMLIGAVRKLEDERDERIIQSKEYILRAYLKFAPKEMMERIIDREKKSYKPIDFSTINSQLFPIIVHIPAKHIAERSKNGEYYQNSKDSNSKEPTRVDLNYWLEDKKIIDRFLSRDRTKQMYDEELQWFSNEENVLSFQVHERVYSFHVSGKGDFHSQSIYPEAGDLLIENQKYNVNKSDSHRVELLANQENKKENVVSNSTLLNNTKINKRKRKNQKKIDPTRYAGQPQYSLPTKTQDLK